MPQPVYALRFAHRLRRGQAVLLATLIMFIVAAVGAGFLLFVQGSLNLSQRSREEMEALALAQAGLAFADAQLSENGADWRPSVMVEFDDFERMQGWDRPDSDNDWYGKYAARQVVDLLGNVAGSGAFLLKVKYKPAEQVLKVISIGRPRPNSPVYRRLIGYKPIPADWIWVTANGDERDPLLIQTDANNDGVPDVFHVNLGQAVNWQLAQNFWVNAERDPLQPIALPSSDPQRLQWLRLRTWLGAGRLPIWDRLTNFTSTIRVNSDLLWYGTNALQMTDFFAATQTVLEVARTISHYTPTDINPPTQVLVYDQQDQFQGAAQPSNAGTPPGSGFVFFPIGGLPRYMDGWERIGGLLPVRWVFNFPRRIAPRTPPSLNLPLFYAQTRDANLPASRYGYYRVPGPDQPLAVDTNPQSPTFGFYVVNNFDPNNPSDPARLLAFRGIYIDNTADEQFVAAAPADVTGDSDGDGIPDAFEDNAGTYRPELAQVYDWNVKPPQVVVINNQSQLAPRRQQTDSGWLQVDAVNQGVERNTMELAVTYDKRVAAPHLYVPPGVEVRFEVVPTSDPTVVLQRTWLIRHDRRPFRDPSGAPLTDDAATPTDDRMRLVFVDPVKIEPGTDPINFRDDDGNGRVDDNPPQTVLQTLQSPQIGLPSVNAPHVPQIILLAEGNIRVSGQVAVSVKIATRETLYVEGPLHPVTANATVELLARRNVCLNFAAARTPIPALDGLNPFTGCALLVPQFHITQIFDPQTQVRGEHYLLPNNPQPNSALPLFADLTTGAVGATRFPRPADDNTDRVVDPADPQSGRSPSVTYKLAVSSQMPLSDDLVRNFTRLRNGQWTLRLVLLHRGWHADDTNSVVPNPWTNLQVDIGFDENGDGTIDPNEPIARLYGPAEPMRTFPVASHWYHGDGRPVDPNDQTTWKEWGILDIPIPPTIPGLFVDRDGDNQVTPNDLRLALQRLCVVVTSPVAGQVIPQGRSPVPYELAGIKLALYDENGLPRPIWQPVLAPTQQNPLGAPFFVLAQTVLAENGTIGIVPPPYFDPTAHPSWQQLIASAQQQWRDNFRRWQRLWSLYYLRHNSVRWTPFLDPTDPSLTLPQAIRAQLLAQSVPLVAGQLIMRVTPQTVLWRLAAQNAVSANDPFKPAKDGALRFAWELGVDKAALPYQADLVDDPQNNRTKLGDLLDLQRPIAPVFVEVPRALFASAWLWAWRAAPPQGVIDVRQPSPLPSAYRSPVVPGLTLPRGYVAVLQQQVGAD